MKSLKFYKYPKDVYFFINKIEKRELYLTKKTKMKKFIFKRITGNIVFFKNFMEFSVCSFFGSQNKPNLILAVILFIVKFSKIHLKKQTWRRHV